MEIKELVCIRCPLGCNLQVTIDDGKATKVTGNSCKRGEEYGIKECANPTRIVTSIIPVENGDVNMLPIKTKGDVPKELIFQCLKELKGIKINAPVKIGDIIVKNIAGTGVDMVATREINRI
ncbi:DUF1667 domain-containing protein [Clostridium polynesiense]|uniref:DUF1667 domain-containing protein n=1 Tax=Clostridium polynesiense TaxID=1325933 RepID=UPI00058E4B72|nr:DUF1667 domain-containing protein [Clostridium polynesiense]